MNEKEWLDYMKNHYIPFCKHYGFYLDLLKKIIILISKYNPTPLHVADFGCGPGMTIDKVLKSYPNISRVFGYEKIKGLTSLGVHSIKTLNEHKSKVQFFEDFDISKHFNTPKKCDLILNINVLYINELKDKNQVIKNIEQNLSKEGVAIIATVLKPWNTYKTNGSLVKDEVIHNLLFKPWRIPLSLYPLLKQSKAVKDYNQSLSSDLTFNDVRELIDKNNLQIIDSSTYYTPRKYITKGNNSAGGLIFVVEKLKEFK